MKLQSLIVAILIIMFSQNGYSQHKRGNREHKRKRMEMLQSKKIAHIANHVNLTPEESQKFWPVYNEFNKALMELRERQRNNYCQIKKDVDKLSDEFVEKTLEIYINQMQEEVDLKKKYHSEFKKMLSPKRLAKYYSAEERFKMKMLKMLHRGKRHKKKKK